MPILSVSTNLPLDSVVISDILKDATKSLSRLLSKPEAYVMVIIRHGVPMSMGGSEEPAAFGDLTSIGGLTPANNKLISAALAEIFKEKANIDSGRFYIKFTDSKGHDVGFNGTTF